jgi:pimeloyl-ACP methyl ester carboxylesterase
MVDDILELMEDEKIQKAHILGHSMGGKTAMYFALKYSEKVDHLLISDISPRYYPIHHSEIIDSLKSVPLASLKSRNEAEELLKNKITDFGTRQFLLKNLYWNNEQLEWRFNLNVIAQNIEEVGKALPKEQIFHGKVLFIRGDRSNYITNEDWEEIQSIYPEAELATIQNSGHWIHAEQPLDFYNTVINFLN